MKEFSNILKEKFGTNRPILLSEILETFPSVTEMTVYRWIRKAVSSSELIKPRKGVYYLPTETRFGLSTLGDAKIIRKKYLSDDKGIYGYITGLALENRVGISNQLPGTLEIATNRETSRSRKVEPYGGYREIILRKPRMEVNASNVSTLEFLDLITCVSIQDLENDELRNLKDFASGIERAKILECMKYYPRKTAQRILESEACGVLT